MRLVDMRGGGVYRGGLHIVSEITDNTACYCFNIDKLMVRQFTALYAEIRSRCLGRRYECYLLRVEIPSHVHCNYL